MRLWIEFDRVVAENRADYGVAVTNVLQTLFPDTWEEVWHDGESWVAGDPMGFITLPERGMWIPIDKFLTEGEGE